LALQAVSFRPFGARRLALIDELLAFERLERAPETPPPERRQED